MGAFLVNFHVRGESREQVVESLRKLHIEKAWVAGENEGWLSFWEEEASKQSEVRIQDLAHRVSDDLDATCIAFLVHDSDILCYWLYDRGTQLDEYNSCPCYWRDDASIDEKSLAADCGLLLKYCRPGTLLSKLENVLAQWTKADMAADIAQAFPLAEGRLASLATLLGLREAVAMTDYNDIGRNVSAGELGAIWAGVGEMPRSEGDDSHVDVEPFEKSSAPLHEAAQRDDVAEIIRLVSGGEDVNEIPAPYTITALGMAAMNGTPATLRQLVALGADLRKKGEEGATPLRLAVQSGKADNVRTLVELGAKLNEYDSRIGSLLHFAVMCGFHEVACGLLQLGVDRERKNAQGLTAMDCVQAQRKVLQELPLGPRAAMPPLIIERIRQLEELEQLMKGDSPHL